MVFPPETARVIYSQNPLAEVTCHLNFPPILKIDSEPPATFQDRIRVQFPKYASASLATTQLPPNVPPEVRAAMEGFAPIRAVGARHEFTSENGEWQVALTREGLTLRTSKYHRWEEFAGHLREVSAALSDVYQPAYFARVGLQYHDVIHRRDLGLSGVPWSQLINPAVGGEISIPETADRIDSMTRQLHLVLDGQNRFLQFRTWIAPHGKSGEQCFMINSLFHTHDKVEEKDAIDTLTEFSRAGGRFFRWCIRERLHNALHPVAV